MSTEYSFQKKNGAFAELNWKFSALIQLKENNVVPPALQNTTKPYI